MQKIRKIAKIGMLIAVLGLLFHDFVPHHHHAENSNKTCHHHAEKHNSNHFSLEQANNLHQYINHSTYSKLYKQISFNFTFVEVQKTETPQISEIKLIKLAKFTKLLFIKKEEAYSQTKRGPPSV